MEIYAEDKLVFFIRRFKFRNVLNSSFIKFEALSLKIYSVGYFTFE